MARVKINKLKEVPHTVEGLRVSLFDEINGLRTGKTSIKRARTIAVLAHTVLQSVLIGNAPVGDLLTYNDIKFKEIKD